MEPRLISEYFFMKKGNLDHCYQLFSDGTVKYTYDTSIYPGGRDITENKRFVELDEHIKVQLINNAIDRVQQLINSFE